MNYDVDYTEEINVDIPEKFLDYTLDWEKEEYFIYGGY